MSFEASGVPPTTLAPPALLTPHRLPQYHRAPYTNTIHEYKYTNTMYEYKYTNTMHEYKYTNTMHEYKYTNTHARPSTGLCKAVHVTQCNANQLQRKSEKFQTKYKDFTEQCTKVILEAVSNTPFNCIVRVAIVGSDSSQMRTNGSWVQTP